MRALLLALILLVPATALAEDHFDGRVYFKSGLAAYERGDHAQAIKDFYAAHVLLPEIGDYALIYSARASSKAGRTDEVIPNARLLMLKYPGSPLIREAKGLLLTALLKTEEPEPARAVALLEGHVSEYPGDVEMRFLLAGALKDAGRTAEARAIYKDIHISAGAHAAEAMMEFPKSALTPEDLLRRGGNLLAKGNYKTAEKVLRQALKKSGARAKTEIKKSLATALFRQKKYSDAAGLLHETGDLYRAVLAYLRSGNISAFNKTLKLLVRNGDLRGVETMIAYAQEMRRKGNLKGALDLLDEAATLSPEAAEDAGWAKNWALYMDGQYSQAAEGFGRLALKHKAARHQYWAARARDRAGRGKPGDLKLIKDDGFYGLMAEVRAGRSGGDGIIHPLGRKSPAKARLGKRARLLYEVGLKEEASRELLRDASRALNHRSRLELALGLKEIGNYRKAMLITVNLPEKMRPYELLYPLAFWEDVKEASGSYGIDPYLLLSLIREESRFDPKARSSAGALGLMQLMPGTAERSARRLKISYGGRGSLLEAPLNIKLGAYYLSGLLERFEAVPPALAAYNAGERRVKGWLKEGDYDSMDEFIEDIPYKETRNYVKRILTSYYKYRVRSGRMVPEGAGML